MFYMFQKCSLSGFSGYECLYTECMSVIYVQVVGNVGIFGKSRYEKFQTHKHTVRVKVSYRLTSASLQR